MIELKPCPFCGSKITQEKGGAYRSDIGTAYWIRCQSCRAEGPTAIHGTDEAAELWNTRPTCSTCRWIRPLKNTWVDFACDNDEACCEYVEPDFGCNKWERKE